MRKWMQQTWADIVFIIADELTYRSDRLLKYATRLSRLAYLDGTEDLVEKYRQRALQAEEDNQRIRERIKQDDTLTYKQMFKLLGEEEDYAEQ